MLFLTFTLEKKQLKLTLVRSMVIHMVTHTENSMGRVWPCYPPPLQCGTPVSLSAASAWRSISKEVEVTLEEKFNENNIQAL